MCFTSSSEHVETLLSAMMVDEGDAITGSPAAIVFSLGGGRRGAVVWHDSTGVTSTTREPEAEDAGLDAAVLDDCDAG